MDSSGPIQKENVAETSTEQNPNRGLLIFLDDSESDTAKGDQKLSAISTSFLCALLQNAGPIIVSASIITNVRERQTPETDPQKILNRFNELSDLEVRTDEEALELKNIILSVVSFNKIIAQQWVIKKINDSLYLFLPNQYLINLSILISDVQHYAPEQAITLVEQQLGLRVNHMKTITDIDEIKKPLPAPNFAAYFIEALWDEKLNQSAIFITKREYIKNNYVMPCWALFLSGHGKIKERIASLNLAHIQQLLDFLEYKICTRLLYYATCYAAGLTSKILYEDAEAAIARTYSFPIMTQTLTDAPFTNTALDLELIGNKLVPRMPQSYIEFLHSATSQKIIKYRDINPFLGMNFGGISQIKLPGVPWFSVTDDEHICTIGTILAKTRKDPLDIATFFAKQGALAKPLVILLYTDDIPFELIVDTKSKQPPAIISMIPGDAIHHIKKIKSTVYNVSDLLVSFVEIVKLQPQKIFFIDFITGINRNKQSTTIYDVIIQLTPEGNSIYYRYNGTLFIMIGDDTAEKAQDDEVTDYLQLLRKAQTQTQKINPTKQKIDVLQKSATKQFKELITDTAMEHSIIHLLDTMPPNTALHIADLNGLSCPPAEDCWDNLINALARYVSFGSRKIIWFDRLTVYHDEKAEEAMELFFDIIIDTGAEETTVFFTTNAQEMGYAVGSHGIAPREEPYMPLYKDIFVYFETKLQLPPRYKLNTTPTQELLTPEAISNIEHIQQKQLTEQRSELRKKSKEKQESTKDAQ